MGETSISRQSGTGSSKDEGGSDAGTTMYRLAPDFSGTCTRSQMEEANEKMFKGDPWMAQRLRNGVVFLQGHDGELVHLFGEKWIAHGDVGGATAIFMVLRQDLDTLAEDRYKQNPRKMEIVPSIRLFGEQRRLTSLVPFGKILGRARHLGGRCALSAVATKRKSSADCRRWRRTGRHREASGSHGRHGVTDN